MKNTGYHSPEGALRTQAGVSTHERNAGTHSPEGALRTQAGVLTPDSSGNTNSSPEGAAEHKNTWQAH